MPSRPPWAWNWRRCRLPFAAAYRVGEVVPVGDDMGSLVALWRRQLRVGQPLPILPLPLSVHREVMIDLEQTYQRAARKLLAVPSTIPIRRARRGCLANVRVCVVRSA